MSEAAKYSEELDPLVCIPCSLDGKSKSARGFCDTCKEHLCVSCFDNHRLSSEFRDHMLLDKVSMPTDIVAPRDELTEKCEEHDCLLEYYCMKDKVIICALCVTSNHGTCDVSFIPDVSKDIGNSQEFSCFHDNMTDLLKRVKKNKETIDGNNDDIEKLKEDMKSQVRHFKEDSIRFFERLELSLLREIDQISDTDVSRMSEISRKCATIETDLQKLETELEEKIKRHQNNKLYFAMKNAEQKMETFQSQIEEIDSKNRVTRYRFEPDEELERVKSVTSLGKLHVRHHNVKVTHVRDINVKIRSDKKTCLVTGLLVLPGDRMVICDYEVKDDERDDGNNCVKLVDLNKNKVRSKIRLPSKPFDLALVPGETSTEVIITLPLVSKLHFVLVSGRTLKDVNKQVKVVGRCCGIRVTHDRKLVVSYLGDPGKVEILNMEGHVLRKIETDRSGNKLFKYPGYVAVSPCSGKIYITDFGNKKLTTVRANDGAILSVLEVLGKPDGVTVDRAGSVFFCCYNPASFNLLNVTGGRATRVLGEADGLCRLPQAIGLNPGNDRIYVSGGHMDHVQEFELSDN